MLDEFKLEQQVVYKTLVNSVKNNKCSHAYLIESNGYSKTLDFALAFAKHMLCHNNYTNCNNCVNCTQCQNIDNKEFLELKIIEAEGQWIKKNQLEELQSDFSKKSILGNKKIYIINGAEKLNVSSSNSLLKFLEEPEEGITAILITNNKYQLLDTIISRCQVLTLNPSKEKTVGNILEHLGNNLYNSEEEINNYINNEDNLVKVEKVIEFAKYYEDNHLNTLAYINKLLLQHFNEKSEVNNAMEILLLFYKDIFNNMIGNKIEIFKDYVNDIQYIAKKNKIDVIISKINVIMNLKEKIKFNINNNLLMDKLLIELEGCEQDD
jgi:DNA polymerase-3 subunit delta'